MCACDKLTSSYICVCDKLAQLNGDRLIYVVDPPHLDDFIKEETLFLSYGFLVYFKKIPRKIINKFLSLLGNENGTKGRKAIKKAMNKNYK